MINVILATHGELAEALLGSSKMVYGKLTHVFPVMLSETKGINSFRDEFAEVLKQASKGADGVIVLCDMQSGTPWNIACHHAFNPQTQPPVAVLAGVNFPMLLLSDEIKELQDLEQAAAQLLEQTQETLVQARLAETAQSDDF
ncbi:PTS fructose transporter subunit IIA [Enterobacteriaceae bacterium H20N1]|uniref:PTS fructose transporter subunit IIA n=1 Tax=Dryocola boscaweniae TaxID=2925397 RepID=A0A9X2W671_9ENTR|nr:PTS fructose transporter subunit IIA [Dryocola boscaweniae]MCT4701835.1 PTS fructose transporter subunit IIA [Dryocola boscaweniae]MCT4714881.1 PTS fructose transporter subunit IIA [Dryocola boscaweniae]MCT4719003.1 PTS fructose transporter subunit IIA [Dryocola boscaweniae]